MTAIFHAKPRDSGTDADALQKYTRDGDRFEPTSAAEHAPRQKEREKSPRTSRHFGFSFDSRFNIYFSDVHLAFQRRHPGSHSLPVSLLILRRTMLTRITATACASAGFKLKQEQRHQRRRESRFHCQSRVGHLASDRQTPGSLRLPRLPSHSLPPPLIPSFLSPFLPVLQTRGLILKHIKTAQTDRTMKQDLKHTLLSPQTATTARRRQKRATVPH